MSIAPTARRTGGDRPTVTPQPMREAFLETVADALDTDPRLMVVLADISSDRLQAAAARHPGRVVNVGIREQLQIGVAGGAALAGMRPVAHTISPFLVERPFEQLKLDLGHQNAGAVLGGVGGSYDYAAAGRTHMAPGDVALLDTLPGWTVHVPGHADEAAELTRAALPGDDRVYLRLGTHGNAAARPAGPHLVPIRTGSARSAGVVVAVGPMLDRVLAATEGLDVTVAYTTTPRPSPAPPPAPPPRAPAAGPGCTASPPPRAPPTCWWSGPTWPAPPHTRSPRPWRTAGTGSAPSASPAVPSSAATAPPPTTTAP